MSIRVEYDDLEFIGFDTGGNEMFNYQGLPFTGILETNVNGVISREEEFQNSYKTGLQRQYFLPSGNLKLEFTLEDNGIEGIFKEWDDNGILLRETIWHNGDPIS